MYVHVAFFSILLAGEKTLSKAKGSAGKDGMAYHNGMQFSTYDQDNDKYSISCAYALQGGWWYKNCSTLISMVLTIHRHGLEWTKEVLNSIGTMVLPEEY